MRVNSGESARRTMRAGASLLLDWLATQQGASWQERWVASGVETAGRRWTDKVAGELLPNDWTAPRRRALLVSGMRLLLVGQVLRPGYRWLLEYRAKILLQDARALIDPTGFARLAKHGQATRPDNPDDLRNALNRITFIVLCKGGTIADVTVGDCLELDDAQRVYQRSGPYNRPLFYSLLAETGVFPVGAPPSLRAARSAGQRSVPEIVDRFRLQSAEIRGLLVAYLSERAPELDHGSLLHLAHSLCGLFWRDLEQHHPGIDSIALEPTAASAWKQRLRHLPATKGRRTGERRSTRAVLIQVRAFYLDIARWAAEDPTRWSRWAAPCPIKASECSLQKENKQRKARMDQRTRARLPVLPALVRTAEEQLRLTRELLATATSMPGGATFAVDGQALRRLDNRSARVFVTDLATGKRRDLTFEEERAFWSWASIEVLRHTGIRIEELSELNHHSFVAYKLPTTGEVVPMLQIAPSKTDTERLLLVDPELGDVLAAVINRVRNGRATVPLVAVYDYHERISNPPAPVLFQRRRGPTPQQLAPETIRRFIHHTLTVSGLTDVTGAPLTYTPHDFRRLFATDALRSGLPPHIAAKILGHIDVGTTLGYAAIYPEDVIAHHRDFIARRRALRPAEEYRTLTTEEWDKFLHHFELRKVALGACTRDFGTPCVHEHSCVRCPLLRPDPDQKPRLLEIRDNLKARIAEAEHYGWLGETAGLQASLTAAEQKLDTMRQLADRHPTTHLGMPDFRAAVGRATAATEPGVS
ncbi:Tyrosine recombinase XerD [Amycolatopsis sp. YIM 10]|nr:Tyrosine recombinase XerD [Amycolatopsis sp. YIM 10]